MNIAIYQIDPDRDENNVAFLNYENLERFQGSAALRSEIYDKVFEGEVECGTLEEVYQMFNLDHPDGYRGRSLSVSDVVEVVGEEKSTFHFCDSIGFREVDFDPDMTEPLKEKKIKVVLCEPGKVARVAEIGTELSDLQRVVGGLIEPYYPFEEQVCIVCNDEGMEKSHCYNPFVYISSDDDIQRLTTNLFKNTTPKGSQTQDPFWDQTAAMLLKALVCYLHYEAPPDEQNFSMVMEMIRAGDVKEDNEEYQSVLDELFERLEERNPEHIALKYYRAYHSGSAKTLKSIQISLVSRLEKFNLDSLAGITQCDEMDLGQIGEKKTAVFAVIPDNDSSFNFIVGMLYTQLFQQLYYQADSVHGGRLPVHVHFVMDEFANVALPDEFDKLLSTMRSREISVSIIIQNLAQLKALFEKQWESIVGNCDEFLYLGGNEQSTHEYVSKLLGKETIDTNTYGRSRGRNGSYSTNYQLAGRELMTPDEVRMLDNRYALLFIRGERPIRDLKYDILHHPNVALTTDGSAPAYTHGEDTRSIASMAFSFDKKAVKNAEKLEAEKHEFLLYSEEELEELLDEKEKKDNEET